MNKNLNANDFVDMCKANGVNALPIANSYLELDKVRKLGVPVLMIRHQPYKTNKWRSYTKLFYKDVTNSNKRINNSKRFFSFKNGVYIGKLLYLRRSPQKLTITTNGSLEMQNLQ